MQNSGDGGANERKIRDLLGLVKFCLETTEKEDPTGPSSYEAMSQDRREWLENAIASMTVDTTKQILENLALIKETISELQKDPNHNIAVQKTCDAIEVLTDLCEEIDYAVDFMKLDGFSIFKPLIGCSHEELIVKACGLIAALAQNNPVCQNMAMQTRLLERLIDFVDAEQNETYFKARSYALYAISSIIRSNQEVRTHFERQLDGLPMLLRLLDRLSADQDLKAALETDNLKIDDKSPVYWRRKLYIRSIFLFKTLCLESKYASEFFYKNEAVTRVTSQLFNYRALEILEHLLSALKALLESLGRDKQTEIFKRSPNFLQVLEACSKVTSDDYDVEDIKSTCNDLAGLISSSKPT